MRDQGEAFGSGVVNHIQNDIGDISQYVNTAARYHSASHGTLGHS